jgi:hypothetical protein
MGDLKDALKTTATVLAVIYVLQQFGPTRTLVIRALNGQ